MDIKKRHLKNGLLSTALITNLQPSLSASSEIHNLLYYLTSGHKIKTIVFIKNKLLTLGFEICDFGDVNIDMFPYCIQHAFL